MNRLKSIAKGEDKLMREINDLLDSGQNLPTATRGNIDSKLVRAVIKDFDKADHLPQVEAVVVPYMRPVLFVKNVKLNCRNPMNSKTALSNTGRSSNGH